MSEEHPPVQLQSDLLSTVSSDSAPRIEPISMGYASDAYIATFNDRAPLVILQEKDSPHISADYKHYFAMAKLMQSKASPLVAPEIFLSQDQKTLASTYIKGNTMFHAADQLRQEEKLALFFTIFDAAYSLETIPYSEYEQTCNKLAIKPKQPLTYYDSIKSFAPDWFEIVQNRCPDADLQTWCSEYIPKLLEQSKQAYANLPPVLIHGDLSEGNIIVEDGTDKIFFVDWGSADYIHIGDEFYISYMTNLISAMTPYKEEIMQYVAQTRGHDVEELKQRVYEFDVLSRPLDVLWAIMSYTKASQGEIKDEPSKFLEIAQRRIEEYAQLLNAAEV